jgi:hypothetical protein
MADFEARFSKLLDGMEKLIREASKEDPDIGEQLNEQLDATAPILDSIQDTLAELDASDEKESD